jgi:hypothetical protein
LIDALDAAGSDAAKLDKMHLPHLIESSKNMGILSGDTSKLLEVVQNYRNLIHPGLVKRLEKTADQNRATIAAAPVETIVNEVAAWKRAHYGYTADYLFIRLKNARTALDVLPHLLKDTKAREIERLLVELLLPAFIEAFQNRNETAQDLRTCYRKVFNAAPEAVQTSATKRIYKCLRTEDEPIALICEKDLFRANDLRFLEGDERKFVKDHLLGRLDGGDPSELLYTLEGIGPFLEPEEARIYALAVASEIGGADSVKALTARTLCEFEYPNMSADSRLSTRLAISEALETPELFEPGMVEPIREFVTALEHRELLAKISDVVQ